MHRALANVLPLVPQVAMLKTVTNWLGLWLLQLGQWMCLHVKEGDSALSTLGRAELTLS